MPRRVRAGARDVCILLVEDDDGDAKAVARALTRAGVANPVVRLEDGVAALSYLTSLRDAGEVPPLVLLVDLNMPRMNGFDLVRTLRADPFWAGLVVFLLTTSRREEDMAAAHDLDVAGYIVKRSAGFDVLDIAGMLDRFWTIVESPS